MESDLRLRLHLVVPDTSRPWLWLFQPTAAEKAAQSPLDLPDVDGYVLQRKEPPSTFAPHLNVFQVNSRAHSKLSILLGRLCDLSTQT